ncbi:hypothetical protein [Liquorilactobacillus nagelii]|jgi:N-methylhydantoinase A/oxoprolinase/acetone carboxylase beta subunit|uniref:hypothetical protein n=1 Tax=Liquorilactobacillus nagelii TaxID=82688 RepID=UPI001CC95585|nr:hypothetical protein [Liquorilactobacillus nagelii]ULQ49932.1 hypothetical protein J6864_02510 [Liquorilactobacillus nagelii]
MKKIIQPLQLTVNQAAVDAVYIGTTNETNPEVESETTEVGHGHLIVIANSPEFQLESLHHRNGKSFSGKVSKIDVTNSYRVDGILFSDIQADVNEPDKKMTE